MQVESYPDDLLEKFKSINVPAAIDAMGMLGFRSTFMKGPVQLVPGKLVGRAVTIRLIPMRNDLMAPAEEIAKQPHWLAFSKIQPGDVILIDGCWSTGGLIGDVIMTSLKVRGLSGFIADGFVRDLPELKKIGIPLYARGTDSFGAGDLTYPIEANVPIQCGGVAVFPGDLILGDEDGVMAIPSAKAKEVYEKAHHKEILEDYIRHLMVDERVPITECYPPRKGQYEAADKWHASRRRNK